jgi:hypothetical protein
MTAGGYVDACGFIPVSSGTGDFVVSAAVTGYQTPASAGAVNGTVYSYRAQSSDLSQWEEGYGAYTSSTTTLARTTVTASSTGSKVSFSAAPNVFITALTADLTNASLLASGTVPTARLGSGTASSTTALFGDQSYKTIDKLSTASGSAPSYSARAWVNFAGSSGTINSSQNVSSVTRNGTGDYTINFTTAMPDANYGYALNAEINANSANNVVYVTVYNGGRSSSSLRITVWRQTTGSGNAQDTDPASVSVAIFR